MRLRQSLRGIILISLFAFPALAGNNRWTINGPDGGGVNQFTFDPADPSIVHAATENGIFRSADGGQHWVASAELLGTSFKNVAVSNSDPQKLYGASVFGLHASADRGATWRLVHGFASHKVAVSPQNASIVYSITGSGPFRSSDGGITFGTTGSGLPPVNQVSGLVIDPQNPDTVYVSYSSTAGVYKTVDGGANWTAVNTGLPAAALFSLAIDPSNGSTLYTGGGPGTIYKTTNGGTSWTPLTTGVQDAYYMALSVSASSPSTVMTGTSQGIFKTTNGGSTWTRLAALGSRQVSPVAVDPVNPANVLSVADFGTYRSTNGGATFTAANSGLTAHYTQAIAVDPRNESVVYTSGPTGIFKSTNRGVSWSLIGPASPSGTSSPFIAVDPFNSLTLYAVASGVRRSLDGGITWENWAAGLSQTSSFLAIDPQIPGTLYADVGTAVYKKVGNDPWVSRSNGLPASFVSFITIDPRNSSTLYTGGGLGLYKSTNGGESWAPANGGITGVQPYGVAVDPFDSNHLFTWFSSTAWESTDGGANWVPFALAPGRQSVLLVFDPTARGRVYANHARGVDVSIDGGRTWSALNDGLGKSHGDIFVVAPGGTTLYAGGTSGGVWAYHFARRRATRH